MNYYINMRVLPDQELSATILMNALCTKLHRVLYDLKSTSIGISFPQHEVTLGSVLRVHGSEADLAKLADQSWMGGLKGYCEVSAVETVPATVSYRTLSRKQTNMSQAKLKRLLKRKSIAPEVVEHYRTKMSTSGLVEPFIELTSASNGHKYRRYIEIGDLQDKPVTGPFDQFGLSKKATVPWF